MPRARSSLSAWEGWNYFLGEWTGEGVGQPGEGTSGFHFDFDLQGQIVVQRNFAEYPATAEKPDYRHDDLMIIFQDPQQRFRAAKQLGRVLRLY
jgi:hypothetical protein